ncbi:hypothetical protein GYMLUDRAFT_736412 [Collybiopsis luxurians FD-317 M1]|uniref:Uncharacterized protein n=1 Tax=Collybiopsis luxurians FD-317 M1 TaxID=944289 RepID=A0A0D0CQU3_9AGAR|nr:hypothetical protein GYMLUDRAFT_736412 [Collybiopsis luxurians FD-317 M1]
MRVGKKLRWGQHSENQKVDFNGPRAGVRLVHLPPPLPFGSTAAGALWNDLEERGRSTVKQGLYNTGARIAAGAGGDEPMDGMDWIYRSKLHVRSIPLMDYCLRLLQVVQLRSQSGTLFFFIDPTSGQCSKDRKGAANYCDIIFTESGLKLYCNS